MAIRQVSFAAPQQAQSPLVQALAPRDPRQMLAIQALQEGSSTAPVQSIGEGLTRLAQGALGGWFAGRQKRESEEASGRLADAILSSLPEGQRTGPLAMALRDPNVAPGLIPGMLQNMAAPRAEWETIPGQPFGIPGMVQRNRQTGQIQPLDTPERARAMAEAGRDPNSRFQIVPGTDGQPPLVVDRSQLGGTAPGQVAQAIIGRESGGNPTAQNPMSSATGAGQFLDQTWLDMAPRLGVDPQLLARAQQGDPQARQQILALRNDPQLSARATELYVQQNGQRLQAAGIPTTPENLYLAHFLGPEGALRFLSTQPNAPVSQAVGPQAFAANRQVFTRDGRELTVGEVYGSIRQDIQRRMGGTQVAQAQPQTATEAGPQYPPGVRPLISGQGGPSPREFNQANTLRDEFTRGSQNFSTVQDAYQNIRAAASSATAAGDMALIYSFVKLLDPTSVVRESEFGLVSSSGSVPERLQGLYQRALTGERLTDSQRREFMREAEAIYRTHTQAQQQRTREWERLARLYRVDPAGVVVDLMRPELQQPWQPPAPPAQPQAVPAQPAAPAPMPPQTPIPQPGVGQGVQVPIPPQPAIVPEQAQPAVPPRGAIPRDQILEELRRRGLRVQ